MADCRFDHCATGIDFAFAGDAELRSCGINGAEYRGITVRSTSAVTLVDNRARAAV